MAAVFAFGADPCGLFLKVELMVKIGSGRLRVLSMRLCVAAALGSTAITPFAHAGTTFVDDSRQNIEGDSYYIVFFVRPSHTDIKKPRDILTGYMFVGFGIENAIKGLGQFEAFGLFPDQTRPGQRSLFGKLPEEIAEEETPAIQETIPRVAQEISGYVAYDHADSFILKVDRSSWDDAYNSAKSDIAAANKLRSPPIKYNAFALDSVNWIAKQAIDLGLRIPSVDSAKPDAWLPSSFINAMIKANINGADDVTDADGTTWEGSTFKGDPHGSGTMTWPDASFIGMAKWGFPEIGITRFNGGDAFDGTYDGSGVPLSGTYKWHDGAQYNGRYDNGKESDGSFTAIDGWRLSGMFKDGRWYSGSIISPDGTMIFEGSADTPGTLVGTRDEKGTNGRRSLNLHDDGSVDGKITFTNRDSYKGTFRPDNFLPLQGEYHFASTGSTHTGTFGLDDRLEDGHIADPVLMFPLTVSDGRIAGGGGKPSLSPQTFVSLNPLLILPPLLLPQHAIFRPTAQ